jgi:hypothetical protein
MTADESSPEKAGVGGSIPSLATTKSVTYKPSKHAVLSETYQKLMERAVLGAAEAVFRQTCEPSTGRRIRLVTFETASLY